MGGGGGRAVCILDFCGRAEITDKSNRFGVSILRRYLIRPSFDRYSRPTRYN